MLLALQHHHITMPGGRCQAEVLNEREHATDRSAWRHLPHEVTHDVGVDLRGLQGIVLAVATDGHAMVVEPQSPTRPVLAVDNEHPGRADHDVIEVRGRGA